jgi:hypothetical protein
MIFYFTAYTAIVFDSCRHPKVVIFGLSMPRPLINVETEPLSTIVANNQADQASAVGLT